MPTASRIAMSMPAAIFFMAASSWLASNLDGMKACDDYIGLCPLADRVGLDLNLVIRGDY